MAKKSIVEEFIELAAGFVGGVLVLLLLTLPIAYMVHGWGGVAVTLFVVAIIGLCLISGGNNEKKGNKYYPEIKSTKKKMKKCPYCGKKVPGNALRCKYCKRMFENKYADKNTKTTNKTNYKNWEEYEKAYYGLKECPHCSHDIKKEATRCPFCKKEV